MADINYGLGDGSENGTFTSSGYLYTVYVSNSTPTTFDGAGNVHTIKIWNNVNNGRLRIWKGTFSGEVFTFDSYTEIVDIDLTGKGTGWITLTAPGDFTAFAVTANTGLAIYSHSTSTTGTQWAKYTGGSDQYYGYSSSDPPYSGDVTFQDGTTGRLEIKVEGDFPVSDLEIDISDLIGVIESVTPEISTFKIEGVTKNQAGSPLGTCECFLFKDNEDNTLTFIAHDQSDGSGNYSFTGLTDGSATYLVYSYKDDTPHVMDVTDHVLIPVEE